MGCKSARPPHTHTLAPCQGQSHDSYAPSGCLCGRVGLCHLLPLPSPDTPHTCPSHRVDNNHLLLLMIHVFRENEEQLFKVSPRNSRASGRA